MSVKTVFATTGLVFLLTVSSVGAEKIGPGVYEGKININTATIADLAQLPAIDRLEARAIVAYREQNGPFAAIDDLLKVRGIRRMEYKRIDHLLSVEGPTTLKIKDPSFYEGKLNINTATAEEFARLPAIDMLEARSIVDYRTQSGPFDQIDDLLKVRGIRRMEFKRMDHLLSVEGPTTLKLKAQLGGQININTATVEEFSRLPTIGRQEAQKIIDYRTANGPFKAKDDLLKVEGIRRTEYDLAEKFLVVEGETTLER